MGLLSGLANFGLGNLQDKNILEEAGSKKESVIASKEKVVLEEKDFLLEKTIECVVCDEKFKTITVKAGKNRKVGQDDDLRPRYSDVDPLKYDVIMCPRCGYAAISKCYRNLLPSQRKLIRENVSKTFKSPEYKEMTYSYDDAIVRHKIALACTIVKNAKMSERAFTCLKLSWMLNSKIEELDENSWERVKYKNEAKECIQNAYEGFTQAFSRESFPMCGMNEVTVMYLLAQLALKCGELDDSMRMVGRILTNSNSPDRIKDKVRDLKDYIVKQKALEEHADEDDAE